MKPDARDALLRSYFAEDMKLLQAKGRDYSGMIDCLRNLRRHGLKGIIVRLGDKYERLDNLIWNGTPASVKDESILDTLRDIRNYAFLAQIFLDGKDEEKNG